MKRSPQEQKLTSSQRFKIGRADRAEKLAAIRKDRLKLSEANSMYSGYPFRIAKNLPKQPSFDKPQSRIEVGEVSVVNETKSDTLIRLAVYVND